MTLLKNRHWRPCGPSFSRRSTSSTRRHVTARANAASAWRLRELGGLPAGFVLATKADRDLKTGDFSGDQIKRSVERSLKLLGMDKIQIMYLHDPEHARFEDIMASGGAVDVLVKLKEQGVIQHLGMAGGPVDLMIRYIETGVFEAVITHNRFTLLNRSANPLLDKAAQMGIAVLNAAPYGSGLLAKGPGAYPRYAYQKADTVILEPHAQDGCLVHEIQGPARRRRPAILHE